MPQPAVNNNALQRMSIGMRDVLHNIARGLEAGSTPADSLSQYTDLMSYQPADIAAVMSQALTGADASIRPVDPLYFKDSVRGFAQFLGLYKGEEIQQLFYLTTTRGAAIGLSAQQSDEYIKEHHRRKAQGPAGAAFLDALKENLAIRIIEAIKTSPPDATTMGDIESYLPRSSGNTTLEQRIMQSRLECLAIVAAVLQLPPKS